jgi:hypothetical protein
LTASTSILLGREHDDVADVGHCQICGFDDIGAGGAIEIRKRVDLGAFKRDYRIGHGARTGYLARP